MTTPEEKPFWRKFDYKLAIYSIIATVFAVIMAIILQPNIHGNEFAINMIVTVFSILSGFLVGIIIFLGEPSFMPPGDWRDAQLSKKVILSRLVKHKWLFRLYLGTVTIVFMSVLVPKEFPNLILWLERGYLFLAILALLLSFRLPSVLLQFQTDRLDLEIKRRRLDAGMKD